MALSFESRRRRRYVVAVVALCLSVVIFAFSAAQFFSGASAQSVRPPDNAVTNSGPPAQPGGGEQPSQQNAGGGGPTGGLVPGGALGGASDSELWRRVASGEQFTVSIPNKQAASLFNRDGAPWVGERSVLQLYGAYALGGILVLLALFYLLRGRIRIEHGAAGQTITRFKGIERFGHWLLAGSFIILAITGLNVSFGRYFLPDIIGKEAFSSWSIAAKWLHNNVAWAFMLGLVLIFVMWVRHNIPNRVDLKWIAKGGGLFSKGVHPDSKKFNAGQKLIFWSTIILGGSVSLSGVALLFPGETAMMSKTFATLNMIGFDLNTDLSYIQEQQLQNSWHAIVAFAMIVIIIAHIYIGSLGMEGAFDAMGSGEVDVNWAREHHNLWLAEELEKGVTPQQARSGNGAATTPAE